MRSLNNFSANFEETTLFRYTQEVSRVDGLYLGNRICSVRSMLIGRMHSKVVQLTILDGEYGWTYTPLLNQVNKMKMEQSRTQGIAAGDWCLA